MCIPKGCYVFTITDSIGDGFCCVYGKGSYSLEVGGVSVLSNGGEFGTSASTLFGNCLAVQIPTQPFNAKMLVEQVYCRVLQRPPESDEAIVNWLEYLESHTVKDLVRLGILSEEFKTGFLDDKSNESRAATLYDVLLGRTANPTDLAAWGLEVGVAGWEVAVDRFLASEEYNLASGDDAVPGGGREGCVPRAPSQAIVKQFYCRVLQRPPESDEAILGWLHYLNDNHTVKDLVRLGIESAEFRARFVDGQSAEIRVGTLFDVLLGRTPDAEGLAYWKNEISYFGWPNVVDQFLESEEYNINFGDDAVPGGGREGCEA
jgi:hypothetical protein